MSDAISLAAALALLPLVDECVPPQRPLPSGVLLFGVRLGVERVHETPSWAGCGFLWRSIGSYGTMSVRGLHFDRPAGCRTARSPVGAPQVFRRAAVLGAPSS